MVYVDDGAYPYRGMVMCHMKADSTQELLTMADRIGVQRRWLQNPGDWREHFDISRPKRKLAVAAGAIEVTQRELVLKFSPNLRLRLESGPIPFQAESKNGG